MAIDRAWLERKRQAVAEALKLENAKAMGEEAWDAAGLWLRLADKAIETLNKPEERQ